jgi:hypothetical protein
VGQGPSWPWSYGSGFTTTCAIGAYYHWSCEFELRSWWGVLDTTLCDKVYQWHATGRWFSPGTPVSSTNESDRHDITFFAYQFKCLPFIRSLTYDIYSVSILLIVSHHRNISFVDHCLFFGSFSFGRCMGPSWSWSYGSWIYSYLCNQCMSPLKLWARIPLMVRSTRYNIMW